LLALETELFDEAEVRILIFSLEVLEVLAAVSDELQETTS
jgi:hypothetical protein